MEAAAKFVRDVIEKFLPDMDLRMASNYKATLQNWTQKKLSILPRYSVAWIEGPDHERIFTVKVMIRGEVWGRGTGRSKKSAEQRAAKSALERLGKDPDLLEGLKS